LLQVSIGFHYINYPSFKGDNIHLEYIKVNSIQIWTLSIEFCFDNCHVNDVKAKHLLFMMLKASWRNIELFPSSGSLVWRKTLGTVSWSDGWPPTVPTCWPGSTTGSTPSSLAPRCRQSLYVSLAGYVNVLSKLKVACAVLELPMVMCGH